MQTTNIKLRKYHKEDFKQILDLFYNTVHTVNAKDYSFDMLNAWAPEDFDIKKWSKILSQETFVAYLETTYSNENPNINNTIPKNSNTSQDKIVGFVVWNSIDYVDCLYVHKDYIGFGIGSLLLKTVESKVDLNRTDIIKSDVSISALPFFKKHNYIVEKEQLVKRGNVSLKNFAMYKKFKY